MAKREVLSGFVHSAVESFEANDWQAGLNTLREAIATAHNQFFREYYEKCLERAEEAHQMISQGMNPSLASSLFQEYLDTAYMEDPTKDD